MHNNWGEVELFVTTAELGSLTRAAESLGISTSAASRQLLSLEARLDVRLLQRTTRRLHLTEAGETFYHRAREILTSMREAEEAASEITKSPTGTLRITASLSFCLTHLVPLLEPYKQLCPNVIVDVMASNRYYDIIENGVDLAVRTRRVEGDSSITIRRLAETRRILAATPEYLRINGVPKEPNDLRTHKMLLYTLADRPNEFIFRRAGQRVVVPGNATLLSNDGQVIRAAALDNLGILAQPTYILQDDLAAGRLVQVMDDWDLPRLTVNMAFPTRNHLPTKVRLFIDLLVQRFEKHGFERLWTNPSQIARKASSPALAKQAAPSADARHARGARPRLPVA